MSCPAISVVIPTYNRAGFIGTAIDSVLRQTFQDFEVIVVDDGSTDETRHVVSAYNNERVHYVFQQNAGAAAALNHGIEVSNGRLIARLDSDDIFLPEKLTLQEECFRNQKDVGLVYTQAFDIDHDGRMLGLYPETHTLPREPLRALRYNLFPPSQSIMFKRKCLHKVGLFDQNTPITEDWDFCIRMAKHFGFYYIDKPLVKIRKHGGMITADKIKTAEQIISVLERHKDCLAMGEGYTWLGPHYYRLGRLYYFEDRYDAALHAFTKALAYNPKLSNARVFCFLSRLPANFLKILKRNYWVRFFRR